MTALTVVVVPFSMDFPEPLRWPEGWPLPRPGDRVAVPRSPWPLFVRGVEWLIEGTELDPTPRVQVVVQSGEPPAATR